MAIQAITQSLPFRFVASPFKWGLYYPLRYLTQLLKLAYLKTYYTLFPDRERERVLAKIAEMENGAGIEMEIPQGDIEASFKSYYKSFFFSYRWDREKLRKDVHLDLMREGGEGKTPFKLNDREYSATQYFDALEEELSFLSRDARYQTLVCLNQVAMLYMTKELLARFGAFSKTQYFNHYALTDSGSSTEVQEKSSRALSFSKETKSCTVILKHKFVVQDTRNRSLLKIFEAVSTYNIYEEGYSGSWQYTTN